MSFRLVLRVKMDVYALGCLTNHSLKKWNFFAPSRAMASLLLRKAKKPTLKPAISIRAFGYIPNVVCNSYSFTFLPFNHLSL